ncbi:hypothetical protein CANMA_001229 [Candida margitis]|uniref:uncharacterized protein n=1 Tax=Candida margitis TaxID=1775924 RepID=UPI0022263A59|nr:uncharacterized protein CANMA_001229 [Candida margitis]KAI5969767.1 hypothetical protein CANMA_001229 [Candida margitis]
MDQQINSPQQDNNSIGDKNQSSYEGSKLIVANIPPTTEIPNSTSRSVLSWFTRSQNIVDSSNGIAHDDTTQANGVISQMESPIPSNSADAVATASSSTSRESPQVQPSWYSYYTSFIFPSGGESPTMEHMPLLQGDLSIAKEESEEVNRATSGWFGWLLGAKEQAQEDEVSDESSEAYKAAKAIIESLREECHYAYKSTNGFQTFEMSVFGTPTGKLPVLIHKKHKPNSANEVFEKTLRRPNVTNGDESAPVVLPKFTGNYREITWRTKTRILSEEFILGYNTEHHLYRKKVESIQRTSKQLKKVVVIAFHNFLPVKLVRALIGEYTGNSIAYAKMATKAIHTWIKQHNPEYSEEEIDIESIAIDGQGRIETCVKNALELLQNYTKELNDCDFIYVVGYSTSSPIAINILAELLAQNHHLCRKRIGVLSMSGNLMGPVPSKFAKIVYRAYTQLENDIVREIFDYERRDCTLSRKLTESMRFLLSQNVKFTFSATTTDSFIPLYSSLGVCFDHPNIYRNLYQVSTAPFISTTLDIACQMKNLGVFRDHNIIRNFSDKLDINKTNKYIFGDEKVYLESLRFALESTKLHKLKDVEIRKEPRGSTNDLNVLVFNFRAFIQEFASVKHVGSIKQLRKLFDEYKRWEPNLKTKEVKYCLEPLEDFQIEELFI